ncbi:hypothetical protein [Salipaludibacillus sp. CF4.18]|uniref:hypothetical protein n=1 Tax=Salipaludibacillus sp. CF4.18 TaxID=3373081 RepID=UPI003EE4752D
MKSNFFKKSKYRIFIFPEYYIKRENEVMKLGLLNSISQWNNERNERKIEVMREQGLCPECRGRGVHVPMGYYDFSVSYYECASCEGSGKFSDWAEK